MISNKPRTHASISLRVPSAVSFRNARVYPLQLRAVIPLVVEQERPGDVAGNVRYIVDADNREARKAEGQIPA
jgi:hypothetical protein